MRTIGISAVLGVIGASLMGLALVVALGGSDSAPVPSSFEPTETAAATATTPATVSPSTGEPTTTSTSEATAAPTVISTPVPPEGAAETATPEPVPTATTAPTLAPQPTSTPQPAPTVPPTVAAPTALPTAVPTASGCTNQGEFKFTAPADSPRPSVESGTINPFSPCVGDVLVIELQITSETDVTSVSVVSIQTAGGAITGLGSASLVAGTADEGTWRFEWTVTKADVLSIDIVITNEAGPDPVSWPIGF